MLIALDWDDTISKDEDGFKDFILLFRQRGHDFIIVTIRPANQPNQDIVAFSVAMDVPVIYTWGKQKQGVCAESGYDVDVWVDDSPVLIPAAREMAGVLYGCFVNNDIGSTRK